MKSCRTTFLIALAACGALLVTPVFAAPDKTCQKYGEYAFAAWTQGLYTQVGQHFAPEVKAHLSPELLQRMWVQLQAQVGKFQSLGQFSPRTIQGRAAMVAPMDFADMHMVAVFACNAQGQISGFSILDPARVPGLESSAPASH
ncbi:MAG: DUF3887 domain-containing protein [Rhodanobacteraceae bacterium]